MEIARYRNGLWKCARLMPVDMVESLPSHKAQREAFDEMVEYGRYYRKTGTEPPPDWKPGDPIPEVEFDE